MDGVEEMRKTLGNVSKGGMGLETLFGMLRVEDSEIMKGEEMVEGER